MLLFFQGLKVRPNLLYGHLLGLCDCGKLSLINRAHASLGQPVHSHVGHAMIMNKGGSNYKDMEDLVRLEPNVEFSRQEPLRNPATIQDSAKNVETPHDKDPVNGSLLHAHCPARLQQEMYGWHQTKEAEADEQDRAHRAIERIRELVHHGDGDAADSKHRYATQVNHFWSVLTVEAIVDPRHKAANCEQTDAHVVELAEELGHMLAVATEGVEEEGESKAEDGADEEEEEDQLADLQVGVALVAQRLHIEDDRAHYEGYETDQVSPYVPCLAVHTENTLEALGNTVKLRPMVKLDKLVVLHPGGQLRKAQMVPMLHRLKNLAGHLSS